MTDKKDKKKSKTKILDHNLNPLVDPGHNRDVKAHKEHPNESD